MEFSEDFYEALEEFIEEQPSEIIIRGFTIAEDGMHGDVFYESKTKTLKTTIQGTRLYDVTIQFNALEEISSVSCSCPYGSDCKHLVALAHIVLEDLSLVLPQKRKVLSAKSKMKTKLKSDTKTKRHIITGPSIDVISEEIHGHQPNRKSIVMPYGSNFEHMLVADNEVVTTIYQKNWSAERIDLHETRFQINEKSINIICTNCQFNKKICSKAFVSLSDLLDIIDTTGENILDYKEKLYEIASIEKIDEKIIDQLFTLEINSNGISIRTKNSSVLVPQIIDAVKRNLQLKGDGPDDDYILNTLENSEVYKEAMVWATLQATEVSNPLFLLSGKANKAGDKLTSHLVIVDAPILLTDEAQRVYQKLLVSIEKGMVLNNVGGTINNVENTLECITRNIKVLQKTIQYSYNPQRHHHYGYDKIRKMDFKQFTFSDKKLDIEIKASKENSLYIVSINYMIDEQIIDITSIKDEAFHHFFIIIKGEAYVYENDKTMDLYTSTSGLQELKFLPRNKSDFFQFLSFFEEHYNVERHPSLEDETSYLSNLSKRIVLKEKGHYVVFFPELVGTDNSYNVLDSILRIETKDHGLPDPKEIESFRKEFGQLHPSFDKRDFSFAALHRDDYIKDSWHISFFETCKELDIEVVGLDDFKKLKFSPHKGEVKTEISSSIDWFELDVVLTFGGEKVDRKKWIKAIKAGQSYVELEDGTMGLLPEEWYQKMRKIISLSEVSKDGLRIDKLRFNVIDELFDEIKDKAVLDDINDKRARLKSYNSIDKKVLPKHLKATLRPYQEESFQWLKFLESCGFGGILADDMGLGKTLQIICLLASAKEEGSCHALVVVPKSLLFNWANEIQKFYPDLNYHIHHGTFRHDSTQARDKADIIISTYGTVTKDITSMRDTVFSHIVLDESQAIKNPTSKRYKAIRLLQSPFKLCVTGTPIQNNTFDLYAQATFTNPGLLGNQSFFRQNFAVPIDKEGDTAASDLLLKMITPFLLRRTKEQVAQDLPDKVESTMFCEMAPHQRKMYVELKEQIRRDILSLDEDDSQMKFKVLDGLLRLRQLCNAPLLVDKTLKGEKAKSVKIDTLISTLTDEIGDGNALVFSQFVQMLSLIRKELDERNISYAYLDGSTRDREAAVSQFMEDDSCKIFLISLKAGNTGLNLTKAQYVFIVDPWWNPAVEAQAIDRTHRIGQKQKVFAYKMICKDTIEEKILLLQSRKSKVAKKIIQAEESSFKNLDKEEIMALLE